MSGNALPRLSIKEYFIAPAIGEEAKAETMNAVYRLGDRLMLWLVGFHVVLGFLLSFYYDTWVVQLGVGCVAAAAFYLCARLYPGRLITRSVAGLTLQLFVAQYIYQMHGLAEMHFFFFVSTAIMIIYMDWRAMVPGTVLIVAHHTAFTALQLGGVEVFMFTDESAETGFWVNKLAWHYAVVVMHLMVCGAWAQVFRASTLRAAATTEVVVSEREKKLAEANVQMAELYVQLEDQKEDLEKKNLELQASEEELRQQAEEMMAINEEMQRRQLEVVRLNSLLERAAEEAHVARIEAELANKAKSSFLANMSHELRTPLNGILGYTQILMKDSALPPKYRDKVSVMNSSGEHLLHLINSVLDLSKIEAGQMELHPEAFDLRRLLDDVHAMFELRAQAKNLLWETRLDPHVPRFVVSDPGKLRQCIVNLVGNAIKFTHKGRVELAVAKIGPGLLSFTVKDTGPGIPADKINEVIEPFKQAGNAGEGGTGLGLAITKSFIEMMGGKMTVQSREGEGSEFGFEIPVTEVEKIDSRPGIDPHLVIGHVSPRPIKILIVDDIAVNRDVLRELLEPIGFVLEEAENGRIAVEKHGVFRPDAILMDLRMPVMGGLEATDEIRKSDKDVKIIAVTASAFEQNKIEVLSRGFNAFVSKPFRTETLLETLSECCGFEYTSSQPDDHAGARSAPLDLGEIRPLLNPKWLKNFSDAALTGNFGAVGALAAELPDVPPAMPPRISISTSSTFLSNSFLLNTHSFSEKSYIIIL